MKFNGGGSFISDLIVFNCVDNGTYSSTCLHVPQKKLSYTGWEWQNAFLGKLFKGALKTLYLMLA